MNNYESTSHKIRNLFNESQNIKNTLDQLQFQKVEIDKGIEFSQLNFIKGIAILESDWMDCQKLEGQEKANIYFFSTKINNLPGDLLPFINTIILFNSEYLYERVYWQRNGELIRLYNVNKANDINKQKLSISIENSIRVDCLSQVKVRLIIVISNPRYYR